MLPKYRRLVEQLAQAGLLKVICGTDTLGVGINVPIRTVVLTGLTKFDGPRQRMLKAREFHQIAGRAGRAGFDTSGAVVVQAPEHVIENHRALPKAGDDPKKQRKVQRKKPPGGLRDLDRGAVPPAGGGRARAADLADAGEPLDAAQRPRARGRPLSAMRDLLRDNHEDPRRQARLSAGPSQIYRSCSPPGSSSGSRSPTPTAGSCGWSTTCSSTSRSTRRCRRSRWPRSTAGPGVPDYALDVVSVVEATLDDPRQVLTAQQFKARGEAVGEMKAEGIEYDERMELLDDVTWPKPLQSCSRRRTRPTGRGTRGWPTTPLSPKSVVRDMYERAMTFGEYVAYYGLSRSEGLVLRYLSDAYKALRQTVPDTPRPRS